MLSNRATKNTLWMIPLFATIVQCQDTANFFYSDQLDTCSYNDVTIPASNNTENGGLCAWVDATSRVYACPATDPICWTWYQTCGSGGSASSDQILCDNAGSTWCCPNTETCTTDPNQINVCISSFDNPNANVQPGPAESVEFQVLDISTVASTVQTASLIATASQSFFSTITLSSSTSLSSPATSSSSPISSSTSIVSSTLTGGTPAAATSGASQTAVATKSRSSLSGGAIAGMVIGALAFAALLAAGAYFLIRKRGARTQAQQHQRGELPANDVYSKELQGDSAPYYQSGERKYPFNHQPMVEADSGMQRPELP